MTLISLLINYHTYWNIYRRCNNLKIVKNYQLHITNKSSYKISQSELNIFTNHPIILTFIPKSNLHKVKPNSLHTNLIPFLKSVKNPNRSKRKYAAIE